MTHIVNVPGFAAYTYASVLTGGWQPGPNPGNETSLYTNGGAAFYVDASRHQKPNPKVRTDDKVRGMNMLFCDGHVSPVGVREAWEAITLKKVD